MLAIIFYLLTGALMAADYTHNPFTLVYDGAIKENIKGKVNIHPLTYKLNGIDIAANVYTPADYDPSKSYPAVVVAHPNGGIKEQVAGLYAQRLAEKGYITIAADAAYQGASGGEPRNVDKPANRVEDIHGMADFITHYAGVDTNRLGLLGLCGGGGYSLEAAKTDKRFRAVATLSMFNSGIVCQAKHNFSHIKFSKRPKIQIDLSRYMPIFSLHLTVYHMIKLHIEFIVYSLSFDLLNNLLLFSNYC